MSETAETEGAADIPTDEVEGSDEEFACLLEELTEQYKLFMTNSERSERVSYSLNYTAENGRDVPVLYNTGGLDMFHSRATSVGADDAMHPDERFFKSIAYSYHQVMCFMTQMHPQRQAEKIDDTIEMFYENDAGVNQVPDQERWAIHNIVNHIVYRDEVLNEFGPIVELTSMVTEWGVPEVKSLN